MTEEGVIVNTSYANVNMRFRLFIQSIIKSRHSFTYEAAHKRMEMLIQVLFVVKLLMM